MNETKSSEKEKLCITVADLARTLSIGVTNAYALCKNPTFYPAVRIKNRIVVDYQALKRWLAEKGREVS